MQWSKLKKRIESLFSEKVVGRVGLYMTSYSKSGYMGRAWITIDGEEIFNFLGEGPWYAKHFQKKIESNIWAPEAPDFSNCKNYNEFEEKFNAYLNSDEYKMFKKKSEEKENELHSENLFEKGDLTIAMNDYLNLSINEILHSDNIFIKALGMLDRRLGKRRLKSMDVAREDPLIQRLYQFRVECEGIKSDSAA